ncbi:MAG: B12-binding domain-containing radical SAM protein [bacterium]
MKVLLINAPYREVYEEIGESVGSYLPLGIAYIAAVLRNAGHSVKCVDFDRENFSNKNLLKSLNGIDVIGVSFATANAPMAYKISEMIKNHDPSIACIAGGVHASAVPEHVLKNSKFDYVIRGEGEFIINELIENLENGMELSEIKGISYWKGDKVVSNPSSKLVDDLNVLSYPARDLFKFREYKPHPYIPNSDKSATVLTSRGCPFKCIFCAANVVHGRGYRVRSIENVIAEIEFLKENYNVKRICFADDEFTLNRKRTIELCNSIIESEIEIKWTCFSRVTDVDPKLLNTMKEAGCDLILYGVESGNERLLKSMKKSITLKDSINAIKWTNNADIISIATFILGLPEETRNSIMETINFSKKLNPTLAFFNIAIPLPGSELHEIAVKNNWLNSGDLSAFTAFSSKEVYHPPHIPVEELRKLTIQAHYEFYLRSRIVHSILKHYSTREIHALFKGYLNLQKQSELITKA